MRDTTSQTVSDEGRCQRPGGRDMKCQIDFADLFAHLPTPLMILDRELRYIDANALYLSITGRRLEELVGRFVFDVFPETPERRTIFENAFHRAVAGETNSVIRERFDIARPENEGGGLKRVLWTTHHFPVRDADGEIIGMLQKALDVTSEVEAEETRDAVLREFDHRIKNLLAKVGAIADLTARDETDLATYLDKFRQRLVALGRTQSLLLQARREAAIADLLRAELLPYGAAGEAVELTGPDIALAGTTAQTMGMAFHELATNAIKYGALGRPGAAIRVSWSVDAEPGMLSLEWAETGYAASKPAKRGFGSTIVERLVPMDTGGKVERRFDGNGHFVRFLIPLDKLAG